MKVTEEMAKLMDEILSSAKATQRIVNMPNAGENKDLYITIGNILKKYNLGEWIGGGNFMVYPEGLIFIRDDSFLKRMENYHAENDRKLSYEDLQAQLIKTQLRTAKREQKLWVWGIITTTTTIVLSILQLL